VGRDGGACEVLQSSIDSAAAGELSPSTPVRGGMMTILIPTSMLAGFIGLMIMRRLLDLFGIDTGASDRSRLRRPGFLAGDTAIAIAAMAMVGLLAVA